MRTQSTDEEHQTTEEMAAVLLRIDQAAEVPLRLRADASAFLASLHDAWVENGGLRSGKTRNSVRRMKELLGERQKVRSLQPKLDGKTRISRVDVDALLTIYLSYWTYTDGHGTDGASSEGYIPFPARDPDKLRRLLLDAIFPSESEAAKRGILISRHMREGGAVSFDVDLRPTRDIVIDAVLKSDALITFSRQRTVIARTPSLSIKNLTSRLSDFFLKSNSTNIYRLIWIVDIGSRNINHEHSFGAYYNVEFLSIIFRSLNVFNIHNSKFLLEWFFERGIVVVGSLHQFEIDRLYGADSIYLEGVESNYPWINAQHVLPREIPVHWMQDSSLQRLYGHELETLDNVSFSVAIAKSDLSSNDDKVKSNNEIQYFAHGFIPGSDDARGVQLSSPGELYDQAFQLVHSAASYRLSQDRHKADKESSSGKNSIAHLRHLGFAVMKIREFLDLDRLICRHEI